MGIRPGTCDGRLTGESVTHGRLLYHAGTGGRPFIIIIIIIIIIVLASGRFMLTDDCLSVCLPRMVMTVIGIPTSSLL